MRSMHISLPDRLKSFVDEQIGQRGYGTSSEHVRALMRKAQDCRHSPNRLPKGAGSQAVAPADMAYFTSLRESPTDPYCLPRRPRFTGAESLQLSG